MYNLLNVYDCPKCGEVLSDEVHLFEHIDTDNDEVYPVRYCSKCNSEVRERTVEHDGRNLPVLREVDDERARWANGFYDDDTEW
jgi:NAD-dependent SIR2 family protein deacetylase